MSFIKGRWTSLWALLLMACAPSARAQWAVIDVGAIAQLIQQVATMEQQLSTAKDQLTQARDQLDSMTGGRGMEGLLSGLNRNYLPQNWAQLEQVLQGTAGAYGSLAASLRGLMESNAVLSAADLAGLSPAEREHVNAARRNVALLQATTREALASTSQRFATIQALIATIGSAHDQKAILDLQARISAEEAAFQNDQTKLGSVFEAVRAERWAREQRVQEQGITDVGAFRDLPPLDL